MIVWGTKTVRRRLGYVADFCPICREFRVFKLIRVGQAGHIYFLSFGSGSLVGHEIKCETCGTTNMVDGALYSAACADQHAGVEHVAEETNPEMLEAYADRVELERRARSGKLTQDERHALIREALLAVNFQIERRAASIHFDLFSGLTPVVSVLLVMGIIGLADLLRISHEDAVWLIVVIVAAGGLAVTLGLLATDAQRYVKRRITPTLARALGPLTPSTDELQAVLTELKSLGLTAGKRIKARRLHQALEHAQLTQPAELRGRD